MIASSTGGKSYPVAGHATQGDVYMAKEDVPDTRLVGPQHVHERLRIMKTNIVEMAHTMRDRGMVDKNRDWKIRVTGQCRQ